MRRLGLSCDRWSCRMSISKCLHHWNIHVTKWSFVDQFQRLLINQFLGHGLTQNISIKAEQRIRDWNRVYELCQVLYSPVTGAWQPPWPIEMEITSRFAGVCMSGIVFDWHDMEQCCRAIIIIMQLMENHNINSINTHRLLDCMELDANDHRDRLETMNEWITLWISGIYLIQGTGL